MSDSDSYQLRDENGLDSYLCLSTRCVRGPYLSLTTAGKLCNRRLGRICRMVASDWLTWAVPWYSLNVAVAGQLNVAVPASALQFKHFDLILAVDHSAQVARSRDGTR